MRKLSELYKIVLEAFLEFPTYLCVVIKDSILSEEETSFLLANFRENKPDEVSVFYNHDSYTGEHVWWKKGEEGMEQRKLFLEYLINKYESVGN